MGIAPDMYAHCREVVAISEGTMFRRSAEIASIWPSDTSDSSGKAERHIVEVRLRVNRRLTGDEAGSIVGIVVPRLTIRS